MGANTGIRSASEQEWLRMRTYLRENRRELDIAAAEGYRGARRVGATPLLTRPEWIPEVAVPLEQITLEWELPATAAPAVVRSAVLPQRVSGEFYTSYAEAVGEIAAPAVFEDRLTYRLVEADLCGARPRMRFATGRYFDGVNVGEAAAHEFAARHTGVVLGAGVREAVTDPCDPRQRPVNVAVSTVTIRRDRVRGESGFLLHWRDPRKVGHAGGMFQVVPVGIFQPSGRAEWNLDNDFSLWRNMVREFAEELCGVGEDHGSEVAPIDYDAWEFAAGLERGRREGGVEVYCLGLGVDPLSFATDLLTAVVFDASVFDAVFGAVVDSNAEGRVLEWQPFTADHVRDLVKRHPMQAAGAAALESALALPL